MTRQLDRSLDRVAGPSRGNARSVPQQQPAKHLYTWDEIFGDSGEESSIAGQVGEANLDLFQAPEIDADEFEAVYLWFLA